MPAEIAPQTNRVVFEDGLGKRLHLRQRVSDDVLEVFWFHPTLSAAASFESALRERVTRLQAFRDPNFAHVRGVGRGANNSAPLFLVSDRTPGTRLWQLLATAERRHLTIDLGTAACMIRRLVAAIAVLHKHAPDAAHGAIGSERIVVTATGGLVVVEHVLGAGLEQLQYPHERYWQQFGIAVPPATGAPHFDQILDVMQIGMVALSLLLGRTLRRAEGPAQRADVVKLLPARNGRDRIEPLPAGLHSWLSRTLQLEGRTPFASAVEALGELDAALAACDIAIPATAESFLAKCLEPDHASPSPDALAKSPATSSSPAASVNEPVLTADARSSSQSNRPIPDAATLALQTAPAALALTSRPSEPRIEVESPPVVIGNRPPAKIPTLVGGAAKRAPVWKRQALVVSLITVVGISGFAARRYYSVLAASRTGSLSLNTNPPGAKVTVDGRVRGATPLTLSLTAGPHLVELQGTGDARALPLTITAGTETSQYVELPKPASQRGQLEVETNPPGAQINVDGVPLGVAPMRVDLAVGEHTVVLENAGASFTQRVTIKPGTTDSLVVPLAAAPAPTPAPAVPQSGWIAITAPVDVQVFEHGQLLGSSQSRRLMVPAGDRQLEIVNDVLGYRSTRTVHVTPGKSTDVKIDWPTGTMALNAIPWAEVFIDGQRAGETPIGGLAVPIGPHEITFRNPDLGEQRRAVSVTLKAPVRLSVDMTKK